jgi:hypothetical protein
LGELNADWFINADVVVGVSKKACVVVNLEDLNDLAVTASSK